ncbi:hypothetical protein ABL78_0862 [Leptomonas seymouri]|uniref:Uncharacterized protein n=1 Tax=Leptomonas seymouri TaxID=5684 RepID=A0A0N1I9N5_LEPSE|nr:hypothetical protein ABL78_0862 [Leptomonas seymouri]|eukprot:KPI90002.1 hypothetical protein ABL78_0862 [Leptomonas seymouri]
MSLQPFRLVQPLTRILHNTLLQRIGEVEHSFSSNDLDALYTYAYMDQAAHAEMCEAFIRHFAAVHQRGDVVLSSDNLLFPLRWARRGINAIQHFPNTNDALEKAKRETEKAVVRDVLRLSTDDLSSKDVTQLWSFTLQLSHWDFVEELLRHFPLKQTVDMQDDDEYRELVLWVCQCTHSSASGEGGVSVLPSAERVPHARRFLTDVFGIEAAVAKCRKTVAEAAASSSTAHGDIATEVRRLDDREMSTFVCAALATTLRKRCGVTADFPFSEAEWGQLFGVSPSLSSASPSAQGGGEGSLSSSGASLRFATGGHSLPAWCRRLLYVYDVAVPLYVRASLEPPLTSDLQRLYQRGDVHMAGFFFLIILPYMCHANPEVDLRERMRHHHNRVMEHMFWTVSPATTGRRGKWTAKALTGGVKAHADAPTSSSSAASFFVSVDTAVSVLLAEVSLMDEGEPLVPAHVPAIEAMLRIVLNFLHPRMHVAPRHVDGETRAQPPLSLWGEWSPMQSSYLAVVLSRLMKATSPSRSSSSSSAAGSYPVLDGLVAQGLEMLRRLLDVRVLQERGTAFMLTALLTSCEDAVDALGGAVYEEQLRAIVLEHAMHGFSRNGLMAIAQAALRKSNGESEDKKERTLEFVRQLDTAQLRLPQRHWT